MRVLLTGAGGPAGLSLARQLHALGHEAVGADMNPVEDSPLVAFETVLAAREPKMIGQLIEIVAKHGVDVFIPSVSDELPFVADAVEQGRFDVPVIIGDPAAVHTAHDKYLTMRALDAAGVGVPRYGLPSEYPSAEAALAAFGGPIIVKPRVGRGSRGVMLVRSAAGVEWSTLGDDQVVQAFAPGQEYAPMVHAPLREGAPCALGAVRKSGTGEEWSGGDDAETLDLAEAPDIAALAEAAVRALGLRGPVDLDVRRTADGTPVVLEVNARFGANSAHAPQILAGVLADLESGAYVRREDAVTSSGVASLSRDSSGG